MSVSLNGKSRIEWKRPEGCPAGFETFEIVVGNSDTAGMALEIAISKWSRTEPPTRDALTRLHNLRTNKRATPVVLIVEFDSGGALVFGPNTASVPVGPLPVDQTQRLIQAALDEPTVIAARNRLAGLVQSLDSTSMPGVKNSGLFANHELRVGVPQRSDWAAACGVSTPLLSLKGKSLIEKLGFEAGRFGAHALLLTGAGPKAEAIAVLLDEREAFDADSPRFTVSPVAYGLNMADKQGVPWLIMVRGSQIRLYSSRKDFGVGRKGLAETFFEVDLPQLTSSNSGYLQLIFSAKALAEGGSTYEILKSSTQYAVALGERLRDKVYEEIIPELSVSVADALVENGYEMDAKGIDLAYQLTLRVFFRMLFQVYAEDRKLLPYGENTKYDRNAIKTVAKDLAENPEQIFDENSTSLWDDLAQVWRVIDSGDKAWGVPAYNGGLFASDSELSEHGAILNDVHISNNVMGPVLKALLLDEAEDGTVGPVDFRSLSVREFGTIYEGLLESSLGLAEVDLTLDEDGTWIPAKKKDEIYAESGQVYFHNTSGQRKGTGSYFTPSFVVEHLLERSLDPALDSHLAQVAALMQKGDHAGAAEKFFDFRVADLAMGSGHFLTSAIDHIEQKMAAFLAEDGQSIPGVAAELLKLENAAQEALGEDSVELERSSLLRRQIARRCIYGLDINPIAVELARVSIWIHTFVRGLPMSSLDHNLVCANSLTGIGTVDEALDVLVPGRKGQMTLFDEPIEKALESARTVLVDAALLAEATKDESRAASRAAKKAYKDAEKARLLFDAAVLNRIGRSGLVAAVDPDAIAKLAAMSIAQEAMSPLKPAHMPALFPEVFLRDNGGFDVLVGNPPWEEIGVKEHKWWSQRFPGVRSLTGPEYEKWLKKTQTSRTDLVREYEDDVQKANIYRSVLAAGPYPGLETGSVDLYKAFAWRNIQCLRSTNGYLGLVMPRTLFASTGSKEWRKDFLTNGSCKAIFPVQNANQWVFRSVHPQYTVILLNWVSGLKLGHFVAPVSTNLNELRVHAEQVSRISKTDLSLLNRMTNELAIPLIQHVDDMPVLEKMAQYSSLKEFLGDSGTIRLGVSMTKLKRAGAKSQLSHLEAGVLKGGSFGLWNSDLRPPEYSIRNESIPDVRRRELLNSCVISFRQIARSTDTRTFIVCLLPPHTVTTDGAPIIDVGDMSFRKQAYLLGVLSSRIFDWYMRRWVEVNVNQWLISPAPIPPFGANRTLDDFISERAGMLAAVDKRYAEWAKAVGVPVGSVKSDAEKDALIAELDALVAHLYGLSRSQVEHVFKTFHRGWDYSSRLTQVLSFYDQLPEVKS